MLHTLASIASYWGTLNSRVRYCINSPQDEFTCVVMTFVSKGHTFKRKARDTHTEPPMKVSLSFDKTAPETLSMFLSKDLNENVFRIQN